MRTIILFFILTIIGCLLPPVSVCWDKNILPKWYASEIVICLFFVFYAIKKPTINRNPMSTALRRNISVAASIGIFFECIWIVCQVLHNGTYILNIGVCGTFDNPCGLSTTVCVLLPVALIGIDLDIRSEFWKKYKWNMCTLVYCVLMTLLTIILVLLSKSRTGLVSLALMFIIIFFRHSRQKNIHKWACLFFLLAVTSLIVSLQKTKSTQGRLFVLEQTWTLIAKHPIVGYGISGFQREYMKQQASYLAQHPKCLEIMLADEVKHPLNEFLFLWLDFGLIGPISLLCLLVVPIFVFRQSTAIIEIQSAMIISCIFSYPFNEPLPLFILFSLFFTSLWKSSYIFRKIIEKFGIRSLCLISGVSILLVLIIFFRIDTLMSSANFYATHHKHHHSLERYEQLDSLFHKPPYLWLVYYRQSFFLYNYSYELLTTEQFNFAYKKSRECAANMSDYDLELLTGDICLYQKNLQIALYHYRTAFNMCPVRFAPLSGMLHSYQMLCDTVHADSIAQVIIHKPIKIKSLEVKIIKAMAFECLKQ